MVQNRRAETFKSPCFAPCACQSHLKASAIFSQSSLYMQCGTLYEEVSKRAEAGDRMSNKVILDIFIQVQSCSPHRSIALIIAMNILEDLLDETDMITEVCLQDFSDCRSAEV